MQLLTVHPGARICSQRELQQTGLLRDINFEDVLTKTQTPPFRPPKDHLNCDPSLELEEMIVEAKPLHKKKKRLAKQRSIQRDSDTVVDSYIKEFPVYNRYKEVHRREMEQKEREWEKELEIAMANSEVNLRTVQESPTKKGEENCYLEDEEESLEADGPRKDEREEVKRGLGCSSSRSTGNGGGGGSSGGTMIDFIDRTPSPTKPSPR